MYTVQEISPIIQNYAQALSNTHHIYKQQLSQNIDENVDGKPSASALFMLDAMIAKTDLLIRYVTLIQKQNPQLILAVNGLISSIDHQDDINLLIQKIMQKIDQDNYETADAIVYNFHFYDYLIRGFSAILVIVGGFVAMSPAIFGASMILCGIGMSIMLSSLLPRTCAMSTMGPMQCDVQEIKRIREERPPAYDTTLIFDFDLYPKFDASKLVYKIPRHPNVAHGNDQAAIQEPIEQSTLFQNKMRASQLRDSFFAQGHSNGLREAVKQQYTALQPVV